MSLPKVNPRVVYIGRYDEADILSGPHKYAKRIAEQNRKSNGRAVFIQYFFDGRKYNFFKKLFGTESKIVDDSIEVITSGLFRIIGAIRKSKPDIIHIITFERFAVIALIYKMFSKARIIYNSHGVIAFEDTEIKKTPFFYRLKDKIAERLLLMYSDKIVFPSENTMDIAEKYYKLNESKCVILPGGIDKEFKNSDREETETPSVLNYVIMNTSVYSKSGIKFLEQISEKCNLQLNLYVIGKHNELKVANPVVKIHYSEQMSPVKLAEFYRDKHVFFSLNSYESFSIAAVEAMACGVVPVVSANTGMSRYILNSENGYIIESGTTEGVLNIISELSGNIVKRVQISTKAIEIGDVLNWGEVYCAYELLYRELAS